MVLFESHDVSRYHFNSKDVICAVCDHDIFYMKDIPVDNMSKQLFGPGEQKGDVITLICDVCGHIMWFYQNGLEQSTDDEGKQNRILPVAEGDYEKYVAGQDQKALQDILSNIDKDKHPRKYRVVKDRMKALENYEPSKLPEPSPLPDRKDKESN